MFFFQFYKKRILWLCDEFYNENCKFVLCDEGKKVCRFHKLLLKFEEIMENDLFLDEEKFREIIDLKFFDGNTLDDVIDFFIFSAKDFVN